MRFRIEYLTFHTKRQRDYINITGEVEAALGKSGIREGMMLGPAQKTGDHQRDGGIADRRGDAARRGRLFRCT